MFPISCSTATSNERSYGTAEHADEEDAPGARGSTGTARGSAGTAPRVRSSGGATASFAMMPGMAEGSPIHCYGSMLCCYHLLNAVNRGTHRVQAQQGDRQAQQEDPQAQRRASDPQAVPQRRWPWCLEWQRARRWHQPQLGHCRVQVQPRGREGVQRECVTHRG
jgi:hypothetical protein